MSEIIFIVSTDTAAAERLAQPLRDRGWAVETETQDPATACWRIHQCLPLAVVIPLDIDPLAACDLACALNVAVATRDVPVVFVGGTPEDREMALTLRPDAAAIDAQELPWLTKRLTLGN